MPQDAYDIPFLDAQGRERTLGEFRDAQGRMRTLGEYRGQVLLIVNTASY